MCICIGYKVDRQVEFYGSVTVDVTITYQWHFSHASPSNWLLYVHVNITGYVSTQQSWNNYQGEPGYVNYIYM